MPSGVSERRGNVENPPPTRRGLDRRGDPHPLRAPRGSLCGGAPCAGGVVEGGAGGPAAAAAVAVEVPPERQRRQVRLLQDPLDGVPAGGGATAGGGLGARGGGGTKDKGAGQHHGNQKLSGEAGFGFRNPSDGRGCEPAVLHTHCSFCDELGEQKKAWPEKNPSVKECYPLGSFHSFGVVWYWVASWVTTTDRHKYFNVVQVCDVCRFSRWADA